MSQVTNVALELIKIPSISGSEAHVALQVEDRLQKMGMRVVRQSVDQDRFNLFASKVDHPKILFCSHLDTVPPFIEPSQRGGFIYGRGACDAKGIIAAQLVAGERLIQEYRDQIGFLYLVGEEVDHCGAKVGDRLGIRSQYVVIGEPTELKIARGSKGILKFTLHTRGIAAHSAYPEKGDSAIVKLLSLLQQLCARDWPVDPILGETNWNIGTISGGVAANVIPESALAQILFRTVTSSSEVLRKIEALLKGKGEIELQAINDPMTMHTIPGFETSVVAYNTDAPYLKSLGKPILYGPGSILDAHSDDEKISVKDLEKAVEDYCTIAKQLLATSY